MRGQGRALGSCPFLENSVDMRDVQVGMEGLIGDIPWGIGYKSEQFGLVSLDDSYVGLRRVNIICVVESGTRCWCDVMPSFRLDYGCVASIDDTLYPVASTYGCIRDM